MKAAFENGLELHFELICSFLKRVPNSIDIELRIFDLRSRRCGKQANPISRIVGFGLLTTSNRWNQKERGEKHQKPSHELVSTNCVVPCVTDDP
jgi:hypothetical protein